MLRIFVLPTGVGVFYRHS